MNKLFLSSIIMPIALMSFAGTAGAQTTTTKPANQSIQNIQGKKIESGVKKGVTTRVVKKSKIKTTMKAKPVTKKQEVKKIMIKKPEVKKETKTQ